MRLSNRLAAGGIVLLDGPMGTELLRRGFAGHPVLWTALAAENAPKLLTEIHRSYARAGAELHTANTFRTTAFAARQAGIPHPEETARRWLGASVALARASSGQGLVLGSMAPLADCYRPQDTPADEVLAREHALTARWLVEAGCDGLLVETQGCGREAAIAVAAAIEAGAGAQSIPVLVSFLLDPRPDAIRLLGGEELLACAAACWQLGAAAVLLNCAHSDVILPALRVLRPLAERGVLLGAYPNAAYMDIEPQNGEPHFRPDASVSEPSFARAGLDFAAAGARILGACCGFSPRHLAALAAALHKDKDAAP